jgi:hypothetical protein
METDSHDERRATAHVVLRRKSADRPPSARRVGYPCASGRPALVVQRLFPPGPANAFGPAARPSLNASAGCALRRRPGSPATERLSARTQDASSGWSPWLPPRLTTRRAASVGRARARRRGPGPRRQGDGEGKKGTRVAVPVSAPPPTPLPEPVNIGQRHHHTSSGPSPEAALPRRPTRRAAGPRDGAPIRPPRRHRLVRRRDVA